MSFRMSVVVVSKARPAPDLVVVDVHLPRNKEYERYYYDGNVIDIQWSLIR